MKEVFNEMKNSFVQDDFLTEYFVDFNSNTVNIDKYF